MPKKAQQNLIKINYSRVSIDPEAAEQHLAGAFALIFEEVISKINLGNLKIKTEALDMFKQSRYNVQ